MRVMLATFGVLMVPLAWYTAKELGFSNRACHLTTIMVLCDVAWLCISRFILLDSMLLFFTVLTVFCLTRFHTEQYDPFSPDWWVWLTFTGISIGCVASIKWVGLFVTALVGIYTLEDLWEKFGDLRMKKVWYINHLSFTLTDSSAERLYQSLVGSWSHANSHATLHLHDVLQTALHHSQPLWTGRFTNVLLVPSKP